jgi:transcription initiation factor TFIIB
VVKEKIEETEQECNRYSPENSRNDITEGDTSTVIGKENLDASGRSFGSSMRMTLERLRSWDRRTRFRSSFDVSLAKGLGQLDGFVERMHLGSSVAEKSTYIYRKSVEKKLIHGHTISGIVAASLYIAIRETETPRTLKEVSEISGIERSKLYNCYRVIVRELDLHIPVVDPRILLSGIARRANAPEKTERAALDILRRATEMGVSSGKNPTVMAATALYVAGALQSSGITKKDLEIAAGITLLTIRYRSRELVEGLVLELPKPAR